MTCQACAARAATDVMFAGARVLKVCEVCKSYFDKKEEGR